MHIFLSLVDSHVGGIFVSSLYLRPVIDLHIRIDLEYLTHFHFLTKTDKDFHSNDQHSFHCYFIYNGWLKEIILKFLSEWIMEEEFGFILKMN
jgi:hypothetical protein